MRTRDRPLLLERAVESVVAQSLTDYELVVVNDGGDAGQVEEILARHPAPAPARVRAVHHREALGLRSPPNAPIQETDSTYIVIHDDDDSWHPSFLELTTAHLEQTGAMGVLARTELVHEEIRGDRVETLSSRPFHGDLAFVSLYATCFDNVAAPIAFLFRREAYDAVGGYDESLGSVADWDFTLRFLLRYEIDVLRSDEPLAFYRHRPVAAAAERNSVYSDQHDATRNLMANRYLRDDISRGPDRARLRDQHAARGLRGARVPARPVGQPRSRADRLPRLVHPRGRRACRGRRESSDGGRAPEKRRRAHAFDSGPAGEALRARRELVNPALAAWLEAGTGSDEEFAAQAWRLVLRREAEADAVAAAVAKLGDGTLSRAALLRDPAATDEFAHVVTLDDALHPGARGIAAGRRAAAKPPRAGGDGRARDRDSVVPLALRRRVARAGRRVRLRRPGVPGRARRARGTGARGCRSRRGRGAWTALRGRRTSGSCRSTRARSTSRSASRRSSTSGATTRSTVSAEAGRLPGRGARLAVAARSAPTAMDGCSSACLAASGRSSAGRCSCRRRSGSSCSRTPGSSCSRTRSTLLGEDGWASVSPFDPSGVRYGEGGPGASAVLCAELRPSSVSERFRLAVRDVRHRGEPRRSTLGR